MASARPVCGYDEHNDRSQGRKSGKEREKKYLACALEEATNPQMRLTEKGTFKETAKMSKKRE